MTSEAGQHHVAEENKTLVRRFLEEVRSGWTPAMMEQFFLPSDRVAYRLTIRGTHRGEFRGIPPTGRQVIVSFTGIVRVEENRLAEEWGGLDLFDLLQQLTPGSA